MLFVTLAPVLCTRQTIFFFLYFFFNFLVFNRISYCFLSFFRLFCLVTKENGKNWDHWWHSLTHIFVYSQGTVLVCQGNTFRCGR